MKFLFIVVCLTLLGNNVFADKEPEKRKSTFLEKPKILLVEVGGTNARIFLTTPESTEINSEEVSHRNCCTYDSLETLLLDFLKKRQVQSVDKIFLAVAGPVKQGQACLTNIISWPTFSEKTLSNHFSNVFKKPISVRLFNDVQAQAFSLTSDSITQELFKKSPSNADQKGTEALIVSGTGLGCAFLLPSNQGPQVWASEAGHMSVGPCLPEETSLLETVKSFKNRDSGSVSLEEVASGRGLPLIFQALYFQRFKVKPTFEATGARINFWARNSGHPMYALAQQTVRSYFRFLGTACRSVALSMKVTSIFLAGGVYEALRSVPGVPPKVLLETFLLSDREPIQKYLKSVKFYSLGHPYPGLSGLQKIANCSANKKP